MQKVQHHLIPYHNVISTPDNESKLLLHQNGEFIRNIIFNMKQIHYQIQYIDCTIPYISCTPSKAIIFSTVQFGNNKKDLSVLKQSGEDNHGLDTRQELNFNGIQKLNFITRELNSNITLVDKAKCGEYKSNLDPTRELIF